MEYTNRKDRRFYIFEGRTKTGKPKYFASRNETSEKGTRVARLPDDYEIAEHPSTAAVTVRKTRPTQILPSEVQFVESAATELSSHASIKVVLRGDQITIYTPDRDVGAIDRFFSTAFGATDNSGMSDWARQNMSYTAMLRLTLQDEDKRLFSSERYCFRGSVDGWIPLCSSGTLKALSQELFPHLGEESFYELM
jgi:hypothetical protein